MRVLKVLIIFLLPFYLASQTYRGHVHNEEGEALIGASVEDPTSTTGVITDSQGAFSIRLSPQSTELIIRHIGYRSLRLELGDSSEHYDVILKKDPLGLEEVVVSGSRQGVAQSQNPIIVQTLQPELFQQINAISLAEGLNFSPGLRVENNCQNCGFTQLRMNGLDGAYSQILLNSRPVFNGLMSVYGLELIPAHMIERVEVVRGGGSSLYGGNAIGGTVNIITKEPNQTHVELQSMVQGIGLQSIEHNESLGLSWSSKDQKTGLQAFAFHRNRDAWDANNDGFTEITELQNLSLGLSAFWKPRKRSKLSLDLYRISEYRRGGSDLDLKPHQSTIAEQLDHEIYNANLSWESLSKDGRHLFAVYTSVLSTQRASYYGAGGRIIGPQDSITDADLLALNAYGNTQDLNFVGGIQYHLYARDDWQLSLGSEFQKNEVLDEMPGYERLINQASNNLGNYIQTQYQPLKNLKIQGGIRLDLNYLKGTYRLVERDFDQDKRFINFSPRLNIRYSLAQNWVIRSSYARGFRVPQVFNEDLHIETVGGAALFIQLDENLNSEESHSVNLSLEKLVVNNLSEHKLTLLGFHTQLLNPFVLIDREGLSNGTAVQTKSNGDRAYVAGFSLDYQAAWKHGLQIQASLTGQEAEYLSPQVLWASESENQSVTSREFLRSPNWYGYIQSSYKLSKAWQVDASLNYTGSMWLSRLKNPETEAVEVLRSPDFWDLQAAVQYQWKASEQWKAEFKFGLKNIFNAYQKDLPRGADRDASYIYGPILPRTAFLSIRLGFLP